MDLSRDDNISTSIKIGFSSTVDYQFLYLMSLNNILILDVKTCKLTDWNTVEHDALLHRNKAL